MLNSSEYITTAELARRLGRSNETVKRWRRQRVGPPYVRICGRILYDPDKVAAWLGKNVVEVAA